MRLLLKLVFFLLMVAVIAGGGAWLWAGRMAGPTLELKQPDKFVGSGTSLELRAESPDGRFSRLDVTLEQNGKSYPVYSLESAPAAATADPAKQVFVMRPIGKRAIPALQNGPARIVVHAARPVLYGIREAETSIARDVQVRLEPPRVEVLSTFHYVNLGGSEFVVYRATPADVESGVRVGDKEYPRLPGERRRHHSRSGDCVSRSSRCSSISRQHADQRVRPRRGRQRGGLAARSHGVPEGLSEEPDRDRRPVHRPRRAGDRRQRRRTRRSTPAISSRDF